MKSDRLLDDVKSRLDIVEAIADYVELKKSGQNYKANCPFHSEKTPSFMVSPGKQIFHCFGCGAGGDILGFVMKYENLSFLEALKLLAKKAGIKLSDYRFETDSSEKKEKLQSILKEALAFFAENLKRSKAALAYLGKRGINEEMTTEFSLGYAEKDWKALLEHLKSKKFEDSIIAQAGLIFSGEKGLYDIFRNRIIFPIFNIHGDPVAFGGRAMDDSMPKYLNSPETMLFKKGEILYALNLAKDEIRKKDYAMVAEGYLDVIMCHQHGFKNVVAPLGTALTQGHLQKLGRFTKKAVLVFDGDSAGISAAKRSIALLYEQGFKSKVLLLPEGEDPDSFLRKNSSSAFQGRLSKAQTLVDFILGLKGDKADNVRTAIGIISNAKDLIVREELFKELAEKSGVRESILRGESKGFARLQRVTGTGTPHRPENLPYNEEVLLLSAVVSFPDRAPYIFASLDMESLHTPLVKKVFQEIQPLADKMDMNKMLSVLAEEEKALITRLSLNPGFDGENVDQNIRDCLRKIAHSKMEEKITQAKNAGNLRQLRELLTEKQNIARRKDDRTS